jgi:hypothetical protein
MLRTVLIVLYMLLVQLCYRSPLQQFCCCIVYVVYVQHTRVTHAGKRVGMSSATVLMTL